MDVIGFAVNLYATVSEMDVQPETDVSALVSTLLRQWEEEQATSMYDPVPLLTR